MFLETGSGQTEQIGLVPRHLSAEKKKNNGRAREEGNATLEEEAGSQIPSLTTVNDKNENQPLEKDLFMSLFGNI